MNSQIFASKLHGAQNHGRALSWPHIMAQRRKTSAAMRADSDQQALQDQLHLQRLGTHGEGAKGSPMDVTSLTKIK